jgi:phage terminase large subunit-like protein
MTSRGAHTEPMVWAISTQAADDGALFSELVDYGKKVDAGELEDPAFKAFIFEVPPEADVWDEANWPLANPALDDFRSLKEMREVDGTAKRMPGQEAAFRNLYMNQRVSADGRFIPPDVWKANGAAADLDLFYDQPCWGGLDLSAKNDLTALVFVTRTSEGKWAVLPYFWTPGGNIRDRADRDRVPYDLWANQGHLFTTPGRTIDYAFMARQIAEIHGRLNIEGIKFDRWKIDDFQRAVLAEGVDAWIDGKDEPVAGGLRLIPHGQGMRDMNPAIEILEDLLLEGRIEHGNHPVLTMCAANVKVNSDPPGNRKFDKIKSTGRIDGVVALAMALNGAAGPKIESAESVYESRGFVVL